MTIIHRDAIQELAWHLERLPFHEWEDTIRKALEKALAPFRDACLAARAYDQAIRKRVSDGEVSLMETGGAVAMGDDLDALYNAWMRKVYEALGEPGEIPAYNVCPGCNGAGSVFYSLEEPHKTCLLCNGTGREV